MNINHISLSNVNLHYVAAAYKERSLKSLVSKVLVSKKNRQVVADIHALKNISIEITNGERVGLLGRNGAGKSTLLKTIAGLYPISSGNLIVQGKVRSLLNLSLGFEPDATGRENIFYRGLLLGLSPFVMRKKESEIVEFADLGEFIDYPIKTYSAGMMVRLAFAITTSVGGDVLLLDEIIGAGDANFMTKAKQRIASLIEKSEILVLASHDLVTMSALCQRGVVLNHGELIYDGPISSAIEYYKCNES